MKNKLILVVFLCLILAFLGCAAKEVKKSQEMVKAEVKAEVKVEELVVGSGIEGLVPQGANDEFPLSVGKVYCFSHIKGAVAPMEIKHLWYHEGKLISTIVLKVKSADWRTYSYKTIGDEHKGNWTVKVVDEKDTPLKAVEFEIKG